jgi:hypothetical protein
MKRLFLSCLISLSVFGTMLFGQEPPSDISVEMVVAPKQKLTKHWAFVVDNSHSTRGVFDKVRGAFIEATSVPFDEMEFCMIAFNNRGMERFRDWTWASDEEFAASMVWLAEDKIGVLSYGARAITMALEQERDELTIVLITDGGFTEACYDRGFGAIEKAIVDGQRARAEKGLGPALICCLGISNPGYTTGGKPSDEVCQEFLRRTGLLYEGGYFVVRSKK